MTEVIHRPFSSGGRLTLTSAPSVEPVEKSDLYTPLKVVTNGTSPDTSDDDDFLDLLIASVRERVEDVELWRSLITQTWSLNLDGFPSDQSAIVLPRPPLQSVSSITYLDPDGDSQTLATSVYQAYTSRSERGYVALKYGQSWPSTRSIQESVTVTFVAGYGDAKTDVPAAVRHWMYVRIAQAYEAREGFVPSTWVPIKDHVDEILGPHRLRGVVC